MKERDDNRVLGALRWLDAITKRPISSSLVVTAPDLRLVRNLSGLAVIVSAKGLEAYEPHFDLREMPMADRVPDQSKEFVGSVTDPSGAYLPRTFKVKLPRVAVPPLLPGGTRPANSLFEPFDVSLLPSSMTKVAPGWAQVRVGATDAEGDPLKNIFLRLIATADDKVLGRGMTDARGEGLIVVPGLQLFGPGETDDEVTTSETEARLEAIAGGAGLIDWTELDTPAAVPADTLVLNLRAGKTYSVNYSEAGGLELNP